MSTSITEDAALPASARRVAAALAERGLACAIVSVPTTTRSAEEAAATVGCEVGRILKSLVFRGKTSERPVLVLASGAHRVDEKRIGAALGEPIVRADADFVRASTGYAIGGIPPVGHASPMVTFIDEALLAYETVWAAAGTPFTIFEVNPRDLVRATGGMLLAVSKG